MIQDVDKESLASTQQSIIHRIFECSCIYMTFLVKNLYYKIIFESGTMIWDNKKVRRYKSSVYICVNGYHHSPSSNCTDDKPRWSPEII